MKNADIAKAMTIKLEFPNGLPPKKPFQEGIRRAPDRGFRLSPAQTELALKNALRYIPEEYHDELIPEFLEELTTRGRIYGYRFRPEGRIYTNLLWCFFIEKDLECSTLCQAGIVYKKESI